MRVEMLDEATETVPARGFHYPALLARPDGTSERFEVWACGCCVSLGDAINTALQGEPVGTEVVIAGERWRKVYGCAEGLWDDPDH